MKPFSRKKYTVIVILSFLAAFVAVSSFAQQASMYNTGTFTPPTEREDNVPISPDEIKGYQLYKNPFDNNQQGAWTPYGAQLSGTATSFAVEVLPEDKWLTITAIDTGDRESPMAIPVELEKYIPPELLPLKAPIIIQIELVVTTQVNTTTQ